MTKRIGLSLLTIVAMLAMMVGSTSALFWDDEVSKGNTFSAGEIDLTVDFKSSHNSTSDGSVVDGPAWDLKDLGEGDLFFDFNDIKPGDEGEGTVSLHVVSNDAYCEMRVNPTANNDNGCNDPESDVDVSCGDGEGELAQNMNWMIWEDNGCDGIAGTGDSGEGDNIWQDFPGEPGEPVCENVCTRWAVKHGIWYTCDFRHDWSKNQHCCKWEEVCEPGDPTPDCTEQVLKQGNAATEPKNWELSKLEADKTYYLGMSWAVGQGVGNIIQSDSYMADISFYCEQARHNELE